MTPEETRCIDCIYVNLNVQTKIPDTYYCMFSHAVQPRLVNGKEVICGGFKAMKRDWDK